MSKSLSLVTWNSFLVPGWISRWRFPQLHRPPAQPLGIRANEIASFVSRFDVVCLQEVWGVHLKTLECGLRQGGLEPAYTSAFPSIPGLSYLTAVADYIHAYHKAYGGLYTATRSSLAPLLHYTTETFTESETQSRKGISMAELDVSPMQWRRVRRLLVFNTHLDVGEGTAEDWVHKKAASRQLVQLDQLRSFIGRQLQARFNDDEEMKDTAVVVVGDLNTIAGGEGYVRHLLPLTSTRTAGETPRAVVRDLYQHPRPLDEVSDSTEGEKRSDVASYDAQTNPLAPDLEASGRIDYILTADQWTLPDGRLVKLAPLVATRVEVVTTIRGCPSDHYPVICQLLPAEDHLPEVNN